MSSEYCPVIIGNSERRVLETVHLYKMQQSNRRYGHLAVYHSGNSTLTYRH
jgi:hypothetical protein